ncbi:MAG: hypothetical protein AMJ78_08595 [Omnitrophica WOR_2 bacterium SM23_29]|nr:MAG: hypothetical protein AMJ78_08595 [Omnitrophica WOR_2 bacterium SM23_29]
MQKNTINRRRNYFIDKSFQFKFIIKFCTLIIIASLLTGSLIYYFNQKTTTVAFERLKVVIKSTSSFIFPIVLQILIIVTLLVGMGTVLVTLFTSHKIAGPLYRLKAELEKIKNGDLSSPIQIRTGDQLQKVASEFNDTRLRLKNSVGMLKENWASIKITLLKLQSEIKEEEERKRLQDNIDKIDSELAKFKTE